MIAYEEYIAELPEFEELDARERRFVVAYVFDPKRNGTQAAIDAGFSKSRKTAAVRASELVRNCKVSKAISALEYWLRSEEKLLPRAVARLYQLAFEDSYMARPGSGRDPVLPGMEEAFFVQVKHADAISALKLLLQINGVGEPERHELRGKVEHSHDLSSSVEAALVALTGAAGVKKVAGSGAVTAQGDA